MVNSNYIDNVVGREIIDSRGNPTVEATVTLNNGICGTASVPSGASTGIFEAHELRDQEKNRYNGKGVLKAVENINSKISQVLKAKDATNQRLIDYAMINLDATQQKSKMGANAILAVSLATAHAAANSLKLPLYRYIGGINANQLPVPMMNILNGGAHATNNIDIQEFMIVPVGAKSFSQAMQFCTEIFHNLGGILKKSNLSTSVGDEGGFAPNLSTDEEAIKLILQATIESGYKPYEDIMIALDVAASEWYADGEYIMPKKKQKHSPDQLIDYFYNLCDKYPIISIEDPLSQEDFEGFKKITSLLGNRVQIMGDDLFVTNASRLQKGIDMKAANAILVKLNQIGTLSETLDAVSLAKNNGYNVIISHRSGETEDTTIADLAVALNAGQIKTGAPSRTDRVAKYNRLLKIEQMIGSGAKFSGKKVFGI